MKPKRRPVVTRAVLEGLSRAIGHLEADDCTDDTDEQAMQFKAADEWLRKMWAFFPEESTKAELAIKEMLSRGYVNEKKEDRFGETKAGWWCDDVYLGKDPVEALRLADGGG